MVGINTDKTVFSKEVRERYEKIYGLVGNHSGVQICTWTKKAMRGKGVCYKQKFYGASCFGCCQMSPALAWCEENCIFCWRPMEWMKQTEMKNVDDPEEIIKGCVEQRKRLLSGIGGAEDTDQEAFKKSFNEFPCHWAISLSGEPTLYPKLGELVKLLKSKKEVKTIFIVTNGQEPEKIKELADQNALPTQLYVSLVASNEALFKKINRSNYKDGWEKLNQTLEIMPKLKCRRVIRLTLIKGMNDDSKFMKEFATLVEKSKTDFVEVKSYMFLGLSRQRLKKENMPYYEDMKQWSEKFITVLGNGDHPQNYEIVNEDKSSRIFLLKRKDSKYPDIIDEK
ncbi:4-demethylwyosine synthase TYW1 [Candidatus Micrarchaeota archaeon]|nr:4-demethylwyosine synthase TYW1 [Candidatus Micrarchaeota archaeon]